MIVSRLSLVLILLLASISASSQVFTNSFYLKYGFNEFELYKDLKSDSPNDPLVQTPAKSFLLRHTLPINLGFVQLAPTNPVSGPSSGEKLTVFQKIHQRGVVLGHNQFGGGGYNSWLSVNTELLKNKPQRLTLKGMVNASEIYHNSKEVNQEFDHDGQTISSYLVLSYLSGRKTRIDVSNTFIDGRQRSVFSESINTTMSQSKGSLLMPRLYLMHSISNNHRLYVRYRMVRFNEALLNDVRFGNNSHRISVEDQMTFPKSGVSNTLSQDFFDNRISMNDQMGPVPRTEQKLSMTTWSLQAYRLLQPNRLRISYNHILIAHNVQGILYNPGITAVAFLNRSHFDLGAGKTIRTPNLQSEFRTYGELSAQVLPFTDEVETYLKAFGGWKRDLRRGLKATFKYIFNRFEDKWIVSPTTGDLEQGDIQYSSIYAQIKGSYKSNRRRFQITYVNNGLLTQNASWIPKNRVTGIFEYKINQKTLLKRFPVTTQIRLNTLYQSGFDMPFLYGTQIVHNPGGFFADAYVNFKLGKQYYYNRNSPGLDYVNIRIGVNNVLNTEVNQRAVLTNFFKPMLPRQLVMGINMKI
ncbi:MAG: hypothetical protein JJ975_00110 [Bacteroidia bacterium]|nr:hypothetical protein [Bacteroidia bacterium]